MEKYSHQKNNFRHVPSNAIELSRCLGSKRLLNAKMENYGESDACLLSNVAFKKGDILIIRKKIGSDISHPRVDPTFNFSMISTEVVWCNETEQDGFPYRIGVKRLLPYF